MKKCPNGHNVGDNVKFCPTCGAEITENGERFCQSCGNERKGTEKFCSQCGTPYLKTLSSPNVQAHKQKSRRGLVIAIMACLLILVLGSVAWYFLGSSKDKYSLEDLAKAIVNYDAVGDFHDGLAMVAKGDKIGFIDKMGNEVIPCIFDFMEEADCSFHEGLAFVHQGDNYYFIDKEGKKAFDFNYDAANHFSEGLAIVWKEGKCGYIDKKGNEVIALTDKYFGHDFSEGLAAAMSKDGKLGFIDMKGNVVIPFNYDMTEGDTPLFSEGYAAVQKEGKCGFIDKNGKEVIPLKYDNAYPFSEGLAVVMQDDKFGFVDKSGNVVIPCEYGSAASFSEGYAAVSKDEKYFFIDKNGKQVFPTSYDCWIGSFHDGIASVNKYEDKDFLVGYVDAKGNEIAPCIYSGSDFSEGLAVVQKDGLYGFIDKNGKTTFDIQNEEVKSIAQAKLQEKEQKRKQEEEEQRKAEEERKRIEEENSPSTLFNRLANSGNFVWNYSVSKIQENYYTEVATNKKYNREDRTICTFFFYPESSSTGHLSYVEFNELYQGEKLTVKSINTKFVASYIITDNILNATLNHVMGNVEPYVRLSGSIGLRIEKSGDTVNLTGIDGKNNKTYYQEARTRKDPQY